MKTSEDFKRKLKDKNFAKLFADASSPEDVVKIAHDQGYEVSLDKVKNFELSDDMLENIAGGKIIQTVNVSGNDASDSTGSGVR